MPSIQWIPGAFSQEQRGWSKTLTIPFHLVISSRMCSYTSTSSYIVAWCIVRHRDNFIYYYKLIPWMHNKDNCHGNKPITLLLTFKHL